jgi:phage terminase large subunit
MTNYIVKEGGLNDRFFKSRAKIRILGGGFANGKTATACITALEMARDYPGSNGLMARATYPKLNDTLRKEFIKWCPKQWIKNFPLGQNSSNMCTLKNGTTINFRYMQQQSRGDEAATSNLLSATYDWIVVDQIEDPEIVHKDFLDLMGRLRGSTPYTGNDPTMPHTGPRMMILTCNPTRNWVYKKLVHPYHLYKQAGTIMPDLIVLRDKDGKVVFEDGKPNLLLDVIEGSTYENAHVLEPDVIQGLESTYTGQMKERFLLGRWAAYEGLVYPQYSDIVHTVEHNEIMQLWDRLTDQGYLIPLVDGYDFGIAVPSCYLISFVDDDGNVILMDGFYKKEMGILEQADKIKVIRNKWGLPQDQQCWADPNIFRRFGSSAGNVNETVASQFANLGVPMRRGNNDVLGGIVKVGSYLAPTRFHRNPFSGAFGAPHIFISRDLDWWIDEIGGYYWDKDTKGERDDKPNDKNDHAMDTTKYMLTNLDAIAKPDPFRDVEPKYLQWMEGEYRVHEARKWRHRNSKTQEMSEIANG